MVNWLRTISLASIWWSVCNMSNQTVHFLVGRVHSQESIAPVPSGTPYAGASSLQGQATHPARMTAEASSCDPLYAFRPPSTAFLAQTSKRTVI